MSTMLWGSTSQDHYSVRRLTYGELEATRRQLAANLALTDDDSPARVPIDAHLLAVNVELDRRTRTLQRPVATMVTFELRDAADVLACRLEADLSETDRQMIEARLAEVVAEQQSRTALVADDL